MERQELEAQILSYLQPRFDGVTAVELSEDGTLAVILSGTCKSCPLCGMTMQQDMQDMVTAAFPAVSRVEFPDDASEDLLRFARQLLGHSS